MICGSTNAAHRADDQEYVVEREHHGDDDHARLSELAHEERDKQQAPDERRVLLAASRRRVRLPSHRCSLRAGKSRSDDRGCRRRRHRASAGHERSRLDMVS